MKKLLIVFFIFFNFTIYGQNKVDFNNDESSKDKIKKNKFYLVIIGFGFNYQDLNDSNNNLNDFVVNGFIPISFSYENFIINKSKGIRGIEFSISKELDIHSLAEIANINTTNFGGINNKYLHPYEITIAYKFYAQDYYSYYIGPLLGINSGMETFGTNMRHSGSTNSEPIFGFKFGFSPSITNSFGVNIEGKFVIGYSSKSYVRTSISIGPYFIF